MRGVSASDGGQQGPRCDREGRTGPLAAASAWRQGDFLFLYSTVEQRGCDCV